MILPATSGGSTKENTSRVKARIPDKLAGNSASSNKVECWKIERIASYSKTVSKYSNLAVIENLL